jgi:hypothetical protein
MRDLQRAFRIDHRGIRLNVQKQKTAWNSQRIPALGNGGTMNKLGRRGLPASGLWLWKLWTLLPSASGLTAGPKKRVVPDDDHAERGDVPGWVMITLMSAALVAGLLALAGPALEGLFNQAISKVGK